MKRKSVYLIIFILIFSSLFCSCRDDALDLLIPQNTDESNQNNSKYDINYGSYTPETEYKPESAYDDFSDIYPLNQKINNGRYYFNVHKNYRTSEFSASADMLSYVSLKTGTFHYVCHDPLCEHNTPDDCKYVNLWFGSFINNDNNQFYAWGFDWAGKAYVGAPKEAVYRGDLNKDDVKRLFICDYERQHISFHNVYNKKIYCTNNIRYEITDDKKVTEIEKRFIYTMNPADNKFEEVIELSDEIMKEYASLLYAGDNKFYFTSLNSIFVTDFSLNNKKIIYKLDKDENFNDYYYDEKTKELFFCVFSQENKYGYIYKVKSDNSIEKLSMPSENIFNFQLSNNYIFYSECDPIYYGINPRNEALVYDYTGGKIYRTDRTTSEKAESIYDGGDLFFFTESNPYTVIGDYLYFDYYEVKQSSDGYVTISSTNTGFKVRLHLKDKTINILGFD